MHFRHCCRLFSLRINTIEWSFIFINTVLFFLLISNGTLASCSNRFQELLYFFMNHWATNHGFSHFEFSSDVITRLYAHANVSIAPPWLAHVSSMCSLKHALRSLPNSSEGAAISLWESIASTRGATVKLSNMMQKVHIQEVKSAKKCFC